MSLKRSLAANIRQLRKTHGMSQAQLAEELDISLNAVGRIERELLSPSLGTLEKLCKVFRVEGDELFGKGIKTGLKTERAMVLNDINVLLSNLSDVDLKRARKLLEALT